MLSDPSYADAYAPAYAKPFIAEEHMAHILGRLKRKLCLRDPQHSLWLALMGCTIIA
jgi:hypothetical protein